MATIFITMDLAGLGSTAVAVEGGITFEGLNNDHARFYC